MGMSIYCMGACNYMIEHLDGRAATWMLGIKDWAAFNRDLGTM
jgi:hypothetical protein